MAKMDTKTKLPLRFHPRHYRNILRFVLLLWFVSLALPFGVPEFIRHVRALVAGQWILPHLIMLVFPVVLLAAMRALILTGAQLLPGSPFHYFVIDQKGVRHKFLLKERKLAWSEISEFAVFSRPSGKSYNWILLAEGIPAPVAASERARYRAAPIKLNLSAFLPVFAPAEEALGVGIWLNDLLRRHDNGMPFDRALVPSVLKDSLDRREGTATADRRGSVIRR